MYELEIFDEAQAQHKATYADSYRVAKASEAKVAELIKSGTMQKLGKLSLVSDNHDNRYDFLLFNPSDSGNSDARFIDPASKVTLKMIQGKLSYPINSADISDVFIPNLKSGGNSIPIREFIQRYSYDVKTASGETKRVSKDFYQYPDFDKSKFDTKAFSFPGWFTTVELKEDFSCRKTGNIGIEFFAYGRDSGIRVCKADYYLHKIHVPNETFPYSKYNNEVTWEKINHGKIEYWLTDTDAIKSAIKSNLYTRTVRTANESGGESYLFPLSVWKKLGEKVYEEVEDNAEHLKSFV